MNDPPRSLKNNNSLSDLCSDRPFSFFVPLISSLFSFSCTFRHGGVVRWYVNFSVLFPVFSSHGRLICVDLSKISSPFRSSGPFNCFLCARGTIYYHWFFLPVRDPFPHSDWSMPELICKCMSTSSDHWLSADAMISFSYSPSSSARPSALLSRSTR